MKKLLLFVLGLVVVCMGCKEEEEEDIYFETNEPLCGAFASKDSIHQYGIVEDYQTGSIFLLKKNKKAGSTIWKIQLTHPEPLIVDLGYGNKKTYEYQVSSIIDTDENILVYWDINEYEYNSFNEMVKSIHDTYLDKYLLTGEFIKSFSIDSGNTIFWGMGRVIEMFDNNYLIIRYGSDIIDVNEEKTIRIMSYLTIDSELGIVLDVYKEKYGNGELNFPYHPLDSFIQYANNQIVAIYGGNNVLKIYDWDKKKQIGVDVKSFIYHKYPNEVHAPQYSTSHEVITETYADFTLRVIFYSGEKIEHRLRFNYETQEIIELML